MPARNEAQVADTKSGLVDAGRLSALPPGSTARVGIDNHDVALVNDRGAVFAIEDICLRCSHALSAGSVNNGLLTCSHCGWQYDLARACVAALPVLRIATYRVSVIGERLYVEPDHRAESDGGS